MDKKLFVFVLILGIFGVFLQVSALELTWPNSPFGTQLNDESTLTDLVRYLYEWGIFLGGVAVLVSLIIGGFLYLTSIGNPARMSEAKDRIFSALIGLVLLFSIYLILNTINPELTILTIPNFTFDTGTLFACDTNSDCDIGYICENDPNPGDGNKEGTCQFEGFETEPCNSVILWDGANCSGSSRSYGGPTDCDDLSSAGFTTIQSVQIIGGCSVFLYPSGDSGCGTPKGALGDIKPTSDSVEPCDYSNIDEILETTDFDSIKIQRVNL